MEEVASDWDLSKLLSTFNEKLERLKGTTGNVDSSPDVAKTKEDKKKDKEDSVSERVAHRRNGSELSRIFRLRRENSDFFPVRHSAVFLEEKSVEESTRRGSEVAGLAQAYGEPVLTGPIRPRRQRTEGDIILRHERKTKLPHNKSDTLKVSFREQKFVASVIYSCCHFPPLSCPTNIC